MKNAQKSIDMTQGNPAKLILLFAIPMLVGSVFQLLYNMVDTIVVGRFVSTEALAAIGATSSASSFFLMIGQGLTNSVSVVVSQAEGAKNTVLLKKAVAHAAYLILGGGVLLGALAFWGAGPLMRLLGAPENIIEQSILYLQITGGLCLALICYNGVSSILRAIGDSKTPLYFLIFSTLLNVVLDLLFVLVFDGGVAGVAIATVIAQGVSALLCVVYMLKKFPRLRPARSSFLLDGKILAEYLRIGLPMCLQSVLLSVGMFVITAVINSYGSDIVAAFTIGSKVEQLATISFSNIAFSFSVYAGQNFGAKKYFRISSGLKKGILIVSGLAVVSSVVMSLFAEPIAQIFMEEKNATVLSGAVSMIRIEAILYVALGAIWTVNSALRGIGAVKITVVSSIVELASKILFSLFLPIALGYVGIWIAAPAGWVLGLIPSTLYLLHWFRKCREGKLTNAKEKNASV